MNLAKEKTLNYEKLMVNSLRKDLVIILFFVLLNGCQSTIHYSTNMEKYIIVDRISVSERAYTKPPYDGSGFELILKDDSTKVELAKIKRTEEFLLFPQEGNYCLVSNDKNILEQIIQSKDYPDLGYETANIHERLRPIIDDLDNQWGYIAQEIEEAYGVNLETITDEKLYELSSILTKKQRKKVPEKHFAFLDLLLLRHFVDSIGGEFAFDTVYTFHPYKQPFVIDKRGFRYSFFSGISDHIGFFDEVDLVDVYRTQVANYYDYEPFTTKHIEFMKTGKI